MGIMIEQDSLKRTLARLDAAEEAVGMATEEALRSVGEYVVNQIRNGHMSNWLNDTGNLRSSVGFAVCKKGQIVSMSDFGTVLQGSEGSRKGKMLAQSLASQYAHCDYTLIIVAGEEYAVYVEAVENKIVLSSGWLYIKKELPKVLRERVKQALQKI